MTAAVRLGAGVISTTQCIGLNYEKKLPRLTPCFLTAAFLAFGQLRSDRHCAVTEYHQVGGEPADGGAQMALCFSSCV
jgi:hypothetical protein